MVALITKVPLIALPREVFAPYFLTKSILKAITANYYTLIKKVESSRRIPIHRVSIVPLLKG